MSIEVSIIITIYNEEENIRLLYNELSEVLKELGKNYEIIFVDDGSSDSSFKILKELYEGGDGRIKVIQFRRNFGKSAALSAGFAEASGEIIITMDADLQDDPQEIPRFIAKINEGYDLVSGWKFPRFDPLSKTIPSKFFNYITGLLTGVRLHDINCGFKAYRKSALSELKIYGELHRYIPVLVHWKGFKITEIKVQHHPRQFGRSKFGIERFLRGFFDLITILFLTQYTDRPLHLFGQLGLFSFVIGLLINIYLSVLWFLGYRPIGNRPLLLLGILLTIIGVQFFSFGLLAEMITRSSISDNNYSVKVKLL